MSWIEKGWYNNSKLNYVLLPLTCVFWLLSLIRKRLFNLGVFNQVNNQLPVIVVGNISVGGTGKTPFVIYLVELLKQQGYKPAIVSRGYGAKVDKQLPFPRLINADMPTELSGDEPKLLYLRTNCPVVISPSRVDAIDYVKNTTDANIVISDDGLQHYKMARDIEIVLLDAIRMFGNGWLLPVGPLRELPARLNSVDLTIVNSGSFSSTPSAKQLANKQPDYTLSASAPYNLIEPNLTLPKATQDTQVDVHLVSGIGNPERFLNTVESMGYKVNSTLWYPDHHHFTVSDFDQLEQDALVLMTEKDAVKCRAFARKNWFALPISAQISASVESEIIQLVTQLLPNAQSR